MFCVFYFGVMIVRFDVVAKLIYIYIFVKWVACLVDILDRMCSWCFASNLWSHVWLEFPGFQFFWNSLVFNFSSVVCCLCSMVGFESNQELCRTRDQTGIEPGSHRFLSTEMEFLKDRMSLCIPPFIFEGFWAAKFAQKETAPSEIRTKVSDPRRLALYPLS